MMGREIRLPSELLFSSLLPDRQGEITDYGEYVNGLRDRMQHAHQIARQHLEAVAKRNKEFYDIKSSLHLYERGSVVWFLAEARKQGIAPKLEKTYQGPCLVKKKVSEQNYVIQLDASGTERLVHHDKLKPYEGKTPPRWVLKAKRKL
jgi:hypothetical protein